MNKYEVLAVVGEGAYGVVLKCRHKESGEIVAIKKFKEPDTSENIRKTSIREVKILRMINHPNIVKLSEAFRRKEKLCLVFEFVDFSLLELIEKNPGGLQKDSIRNYVYQMLKATQFLHNMEVVHRDIKPENLLVTKEDVVKLCDFGFARTVGAEGANLTNYVATRWYRSPELLITPSYGKKVDIWAVGCIMAEMIDGEPLFPGDNLIEQIDVIQKVLGNFPTTLKNLMKDNSQLKDAKLRDIPKPETLEKRYRGKICTEGLQLLKLMLELDPASRPSAEELLSHPYFDSINKRRVSISPTPIPEKRVHSSTYRTAKYGLNDTEDDFETSKRIPSHSQERRSQMRSTGVFGTFDLRGNDGNSSQLSSNLQDHHLLGEKKKSFGSTKMGFSIKGEQLGRKEKSSGSRKVEERENSKGEYSEQHGTRNAAQMVPRRKVLDPKKSTSNFKMFRIREEIEYESSKRNMKPRNKSRKLYEEQESFGHGGFLPHINHNIVPHTSSRRSEYQQSIYGSFSKAQGKFDRKTTKAMGTTFFLVNK